MTEDQLKVTLFLEKGAYGHRLDEIIKNGALYFPTWVERQQAIDDCLNTLRKRMWEAISDFESDIEDEL